MKRERGDHEENEEHKSNEEEEEEAQQRGHHKCPRCDSLNTKFCYYNNYSLSQPRHFCKDCRRFWTQGGTLRNVPIGGGCRKPKRGKATRSSSLSTSSGPSIMPLKPQDQLQQKPVRMPTIPGSTSSLSGASQYYPSGAGYMSTSPYFNQPLNHFAQPVASSNLSMFQGYNSIASSYGQRQMQGVPPTPFYPLGSGINMEPPPPMYPIWANATSPTTVTSVAAQPALWNTTVGNKCNTNNIAGHPNQWSDGVGGSFDEGGPSK